MILQHINQTIDHCQHDQRYLPDNQLFVFLDDPPVSQILITFEPLVKESDVDYPLEQMWNELL